MTSPAELQAIREPVKRYYGWKSDMNTAPHEQVRFDEFVLASAFDAQLEEVRRLKDLLRKARTFVSWHTRPEPEDVKPELREIDAALGSQP